MPKTNKKSNPSMMEYMKKRAEMGGPNAPSKSVNSGTAIYSMQPRTASYQDSMNAYNSIKGKAAGAENLKPKGGPKKYIGQTKK